MAIYDGATVEVSQHPPVTLEEAKHLLADMEKRYSYSLDSANATITRLTNEKIILSHRLSATLKQLETLKKKQMEQENSMKKLLTKYYSLWGLSISSRTIASLRKKLATLPGN